MDTPEDCRKWVEREWPRQTARIWSELQYQYGVRIPRPDRDEVESNFSHELDALVFVPDLTVRREKLAALVEEFRELGEEALGRTLRAVQENLQLAVTPREEIASPERPTDPFRLRHRLAVLRFVADREVSLLAQLQGRLKPPRRVAWPPMAADWRHSYPRDPLKPETLARHFRRARADRRVVAMYVSERRAFWQQHSDVFDALGPPERLRLARTPDGGHYRITGRRPEPEGRALEAARDRQCALTATILAWPRQTRFCRTNCVRCRLPSQLLGMGVIAGDRRALRSRGKMESLRADTLAAFDAQWRAGTRRSEPVPRDPGPLVSREEALSAAERALAALRRARRRQEPPPG